MHSRAAVAAALRLRDEEGLGAVRVARRLGLSVGTVRDWHAGKLPRHSRTTLPNGDPLPLVCPVWGQDEHVFKELPRAYAYLLGLYLGDGTISKHRRGVYRLRIFLDKKYPGIVAECDAAMSAVMPANAVERLLTPSNCFQVSSCSRAWPCLFPQHGPGMKYTRRIWLAEWQQELADRWPKALLRGLIQSDGCRFTNTRGKSDTWSAPRYGFANRSTDITSIFCAASTSSGSAGPRPSPRTRRKR